MSGGSAERITVGANVDLADVNTLKLIKAADAKMVSDVGFFLVAGAAMTAGGERAGLSNTSMTVSFLSRYLENFRKRPQVHTQHTL